MLRSFSIVSVISLALCPWAAAELAFPRDHGPHPDHRIESWYFSGRLAGEKDQQYGFHLGFFRIGVQADRPKATHTGSSAWQIEQIYRTELGITDLSTGRFESYQHLTRSALGLAGARADPFRVWVYDWVVEAAPNSPTTFRLRASWGNEARLELEIKAAKRPVVPSGLPLLRGGASGNGMSWYSVTRMLASGRLEFGDSVHTVKGHVWLDRLWRDASFDLITALLASTERTGFLSAGQIAINRFALLLENGWELLLFQMHRRDGSGVPIPSGTLIYGDGSSRTLSGDDLTLLESAHWTGADGVRYPAAWRITVPDDGIDLTVNASAPDQEVRQTVRYWAGAVDVSGEALGRPISGHGHAALVGYGG